MALTLGVNKLFGGSSGIPDPYVGYGGVKPPLVADFENEYYRADGSRVPFSSLLTYSTTSASTMVDSDGVLKWAPHNLLPYSEQFDSWTSTGITVTANSTTAPDGTATADKLVSDASSGFHRSSKSPLVLTTDSYTLSCFMKSGEYTAGALSIYDGSAFTARALFDLSLGTLTLVDGSASITSVGNGWFLCSVTGNGGASASIYVSVNTAYTFVGSSGSGIYVWGAHLYRSDLGGMVSVPADARVADSTTYVPTTSAAVYLPRRGHHVYNGAEWVNEGLLIESEARTNLLTYSSEFDNAAWTKLNCTATANAVLAPDGTTTADVLTDDATNGVHSFERVPTTSSGISYTFGVFAKANTLTKVVVTLDGNNSVANASFDLSLGTVATVYSGSASIVDHGNGWYRCTVTGTTVNTAPYLRIRAVDAAGSTSYAGTGQSLYIWGAQLEAGSTASSYIPTGSATVTRAAQTATIAAANLAWPSDSAYNARAALVTAGWTITDGGVA